MLLFLKIIFKGLKKFVQNKNERMFIYLVILYGNKKRYIEKNIKINSIKLKIPDCLSFIWQYKEIFVDEGYKFLTNSSDPVIYDCGANIGVSCIYFSRSYPSSKIKAFEADPNIVKVLRENMDRNKVKNIEIIDKAVWINNAGIEISLEGADGASIYSKNNVTKVSSVRLKDLIEEEIKIDMLKIDIEGAEYDVLLDCRNSLRNIENIFIEYHSFENSNQRLSEILEILETNNFRYFIKPVNDRSVPFVNRVNKSNPNMDLQLNIYAYKKSI